MIVLDYRIQILPAVVLLIPPGYEKRFETALSYTEYGAYGLERMHNISDLVSVSNDILSLYTKDPLYQLKHVIQFWNSTELIMNIYISMEDITDDKMKNNIPIMIDKNLDLYELGLCYQEIMDEF